MHQGYRARRIVLLGAVVTALAIAAPIGAGDATTGDKAESLARMTTTTGNLPPAFLLQWGSQGSGNGQFQAAQFVAAHPSGFVYVTDQNLNRVQKFNGQGTYMSQWGSIGTAEGQFDHAWGLAVDSPGNVYVGDTDNNRIQKFDGNGTFERMWGYGVLTGASTFEVCTSGCQAGIDGGALGSLYFVGGLAVDAAGKIYASGWGNNHVVKFNSDGSFIDEWGSSGTAEGQFTGGPGDVAVDGDGYVFTTEETNARVQVFNASGNFVRMWGYGVSSGTANFEVCTSGCQAGVQGTGDWQFNSLAGVAVDADNNIYVADFYNNRVSKFDRLGNRLTKWGTGNGALSGPIGINIVGSSLYLTDRWNYRIIKYGGPYFETYVGEPEQR